MDAIERAIRSALEKGASQDRAFRERVYRQAFGALERALQANPSVTVETAIRRRKGLQDKITQIESEFLPAAAPAPVEPEPAAEPVLDATDAEVAAAGHGSAPIPDATGPSDATPAPDVSLADARAEPSMDVPPPGQRVEPQVEEPEAVETVPMAPEIRVETAGGPTPVVPDIMVETEPEQPPVEDRVPAGGVSAAESDRRLDRSERRRPFAAIFFGITLLCAIAIGIWWAIQTGLINPPSQEITGIEQPPAETEDFEPGAEGEPIKPGQADPERTWIPVFGPGDPSTVNAPGDAKAEVIQEPAGQFMRIRSGSSGSAVLFDVGQGVLEQIAGKKATFDIVARAEEGQDTQMSVACNFGELGDCGRKRYAVAGARADYLFEIDMPKVTPGAGGTIAINSDFANAGKAVNIYEIKVSVAE